MTEPVPETGGSYTEGIIGQPRYVNPVLSSVNEVDEDIVTLVYAGLTGHTGDGRLTDRLADRIEVSEDGKRYTAHIRETARFHDGEPVLADDVVFTVSLIQDPAYRSPLRQVWQGVDAHAEDDRTVVFELSKPYFGFREHLSVGILPKHVWQDISAERFPLADANLMPVGAGPYRFFDYEKDTYGNIISYKLRAFHDYFDGEPYITEFSFEFYQDEDGLVAAYGNGNRGLLGMSPLSIEKASEFFGRPGTTIREFRVPRLFAVFLNPVKSVPLGYAEVRKALTLATDRERIVDEVFSGHATAVRTPFLPFMEGNPDIPDVPEDVTEANRVLDEAGWTRGGGGIREKDGVRLSFRLSVPDWPELRNTADRLAVEWAEIGVETEVDVRPISELSKDVIRPREYDALLYGEEMNIDPDFYSFWHSSEKEDPGSNFALFGDGDADDLLLSLREETDPEKRREKFGAFLRILAEKYPAIFLYTPDVLYPVSDTVEGWDLSSAKRVSSRFVGAEKWYVRTKRVFR